MSVNPPGGSGLEDLADANRRLSTLYGISQLIVRIESVEETVRAIIGLLARALALRSVVVVLLGPGTPRTITHAAEGAGGSWAEAHALASYAYLTGAAPAQRRRAVAGPSGAGPGHLIALPIVVEARPTFGVLQTESAARPSEQDLMLINAVVNQLANALEWRTIVETRQSSAEALARENARLLRKANQAIRTREDLMAIVSHDLRNQLNVILMSVTLLLRKRPRGDQERRATKNMVTIQRSAQDMSRLIGDLLDLASLETGNLALTRLPELVGPLVHGALELQEELAAAQSLRLESEVIGPETLVLCDRQRIHQVLFNLIGNAIKFTPPGGVVGVRAVPQEHQVRFAVSDTGAGILGDELPHVFERFWRGSRTTQAGTGLGMTIAKGIIESHGGTIWLESQVGVGTTVYFTLPIAPSA